MGKGFLFGIQQSMRFQSRCCSWPGNKGGKTHLKKSSEREAWIDGLKRLRAGSATYIRAPTQYIGSTFFGHDNSGIGK